MRRRSTSKTSSPEVLKTLAHNVIACDGVFNAINSQQNKKEFRVFVGEYLVFVFVVVVAMCSS